MTDPTSLCFQILRSVPSPKHADRGESDPRDEGHEPTAAGQQRVDGQEEAPADDGHRHVVGRARQRVEQPGQQRRGKGSFTARESECESEIFL